MTPSLRPSTTAYTPHQQLPVDVSRVTILPVSMTTTCCCPPLICLSLSPPCPPCLHSPRSSSPLSCLPLCTLLVFQGQRGSQADSEIETEIGLAKWGGENYNNGTEDRQRKAGGQKSPRRRYGTLRLQTFALFGLCRLHRLHPQHFHNLIWSQL